MEEKVYVSVVIIVRNEERNLADCLSTVKWADEVVLFDDGSTDKTAEIAKEFGVKVLKGNFPNEGAKRNFAYSQARNRWVLSLDADERVTPELAKEITSLLKRKNIFHNGFSIPRRNYIGNYWIRYGGFYPAGQLRLFKKDAFSYEETTVHPRAFLKGSCGHLKSDLVHYSWKDFNHLFAKLNSQSDLEAKKILVKKKVSLGRYLYRAVDRFVRRYFVKKGYRDGFIGFIMAFSDSLYQLFSYAKYWEIRKNSKL